MNYAELTATPKIDTRDVNLPISQPTSVPDLEPLTLSPVLEEWVEERKNYYGEIVIPKHVDEVEIGEKPEHVFWMRRVGTDEVTMEDYDYYQIGCEHLPAAEAADNHSGMFACRALMIAFNRRAEAVDQAFHHSDTLVQFIEFNPRKHKVVLDSKGKNMAELYMVNLLDHTYQHPDVWIANHLGGSHDTNLLALSMGQDPSVIQKLAKRLEARGLVEFASETSITLSGAYRRFLEQFVDKQTDLALQ
jgi:hypothetical protein